MIQETHTIMVWCINIQRILTTEIKWLNKVSKTWFQTSRKDENLGAYGGVKQNKHKSYKVKFAMKDKHNNIAVMSYQFEKDAEKFKKDILAKGGKAILTKEDAPANATGTAV